ncbi:hypothetical protein [Methylobacterium longum]|uniref:Uncharacterized protein n=1 Tax=Methylobacterium longum TaxID=767694 RepID=A0ABT8AR29_9HYPH|nr:hypothetical protein [Methylobacterium longum]MDN3572363.1 hypothetical protein [Methylobacterium longum]GJE09493.1 hypothetical protein FOHLNKBM_0517 [Methylobacterium longum]
MAVANVQNIRRLVARLRADQELQAILDRNAFVVAGTATLVLDLNSRSQDYRYRLANQWCEDHATGRWRRRICERRGNAILDTVTFEFESTADATALREWLTTRGW